MRIRCMPFLAAGVVHVHARDAPLYLQSATQWLSEMVRLYLDLSVTPLAMLPRDYIIGY